MYVFRRKVGCGMTSKYDVAQWRVVADSVSENFMRLVDSAYTNGESTMPGADRPSAREVSNAIFAQDQSYPATTVVNGAPISNLFWVWGQFIDHDIDLTGEGHDEQAPITVPVGDPQFDPFATGNNIINFTRSGFQSGTGENGVAREQTNIITPLIDASMVYGSDTERNDALRDADGKLKLDSQGYLPYNDSGLENAGEMGRPLMLAGDVRANENVGLLSMQTLFVREHNRLADEIAAENPDFSAEEIYQHARILVESIIQKITYVDFLPYLLGPNALPDYAGFQANVDPQISNIFATAAFRFGHSMLAGEIERINENGSTIHLGHLALREAFFNPDKLLETGVESVFRGLASSTAQAIDTAIIDDVRNFLFGPPGAGGFDLAALNIQRGRDHGLPDYNSVREQLGLSAVQQFSDITSDAVLAAQLADLYGTVDNIDVFVGGLAEDAVAGSMVGELWQTIIAEQFTRLRDGDPLFYQNRLSEADLIEVEQTSLADIIIRNSEVNALQQAVFEDYQRVAGSDQTDKMQGNDENELLLAQNAKDYVNAGGGNDEVYAGEGDDWAHGEQGDDILRGELGDDRLFGQTGSDILHGGAGDDLLVGGDDHDWLIGGAGQDILHGGNGPDVFYLDANDAVTRINHVDLILDFDVTEDVLVIAMENPNFASISLQQYYHTTVISIDGAYAAGLLHQNMTEFDLQQTVQLVD